MGLNIYALPVDVPAPEVTLYWHARRNDDPAHKWLRGAVRELAAELWG